MAEKQKLPEDQRDISGDPKKGEQEEPAHTEAAPLKPITPAVATKPK